VLDYKGTGEDDIKKYEADPVENLKGLFLILKFKSYK